MPIVRYHVEIRTKNEVKFSRFTDDFISECEYEVKGLIENHEYEFRIVAENKIGESEPSEPTRSFKAKDQVPGMPPEIGEVADCSGIIGNHGKIEVHVTGSPIPDIIWKKGARILKTEITSKYSVSYAQSVAVLLINNLEEEDAGNYSIEAVNSAGNDSKTIKFIVRQAPEIHFENKFKKSLFISVGSNLRIPFKIIGTPKPEVIWSKNGNRLKKNDKPNIDNTIEDVFNFVIKQCDRNDSGIYSLNAKNELGKADAKVEVNVVDVPDRPEGPLEIEVDSKSHATLTWKAPKWNGNSDLIQYVIETAKIYDATLTKSNKIFYFICL